MFTAAYPGVCALDLDPVLVGDLVEYGLDGELQHVACGRRLDLAVAAGICPECFMQRSVAGTCGCL